MQANWDVSVFYTSFDDPALRADIDAIKTLTGQGQAMLVQDLPTLTKLESLVTQLETLTNKLSRAYLYCQLTLSVEAENREAFRILEELSALSVDTQVFQSACTRYIGTLTDLDTFIQSSPILRANDFVLREAQREAAHMLPESMEKWMLRMSLSGGVCQGV